VQVVIALIVTPEGFPLGYEVLPGKRPRNRRLASGLVMPLQTVERPTR
jgi:hypothetical protein